MKFSVSGMVELKNGRRTFAKEVEAKSENHAKELVYSLFGSANGVNRNKVRIEGVSRVD
ncbi:MAG: 50S ribosomal protein L18Ae [Candidatus ainarchaeum sp.]|nr:50S ribosomal protein L18Ae [Candidatus ainarchaeum sp.]